MRIVFMGTPDFSVPVLTEIVGQGHEVAAVYTRAPRPAGRGMELKPSPVHILADRLGIPVHTPKSLRSPEAADLFASALADHDTDDPPTDPNRRFSGFNATLAPSDAPPAEAPRLEGGLRFERLVEPAVDDLGFGVDEPGAATDDDGLGFVVDEPGAGTDDDDLSFVFAEPAPAGEPDPIAGQALGEAGPCGQ